MLNLIDYPRLKLIELMIILLIINIKYIEIIHFITLLTININHYETNKPLLLVAITLMMPAIILALKVEPTADEQITAVIFGILSAIVSYLSRD